MCLGAKSTRADADKIMTLLFKGYRERQVGEDIGVSHGTVGNVRWEFVERAKEAIIVRAASDYGVEKLVKGLMKLGARANVELPCFIDVRIWGDIIDELKIKQVGE